MVRPIGASAYTFRIAMATLLCATVLVPRVSVAQSSPPSHIKRCSPGAKTCAAARLSVDREPACLHAAPDLHSLQDAFASLADRVRPGVVAVAGYRDGVSEPFDHGSGFVIGADGFIATNHHVVEGADSIRITMHDGTQYDARVAGVERRFDLAVLTIPATDLVTLDIADSSTARTGHWVFSLGNPFGMAQSDGVLAMGVGILSATGKSLTGMFGTEHDDRDYGGLIQTTLNFRPGSSGGPVFNIDGEILGIATATYPEEGDEVGNSFAIPLNERTQRILNSLMEGRAITHGVLGAETRTAAPEVVDGPGIVPVSGAAIVRVSGGGSRNPAARAGLRRQDVITRFGGHLVASSDDLIRLVSSTAAGHEVQIVYYRKGAKKTTTVTLVEREVVAPARRPSKAPTVALRMLTWNGAMLVQPTAGYLAQRGLAANSTGLYVSDVPIGTQLHKAGLRPGAFVLTFDGNTVKTIDDFIRADDGASNLAKLKLSDGSTIDVMLDRSK